VPAEQLVHVTSAVVEKLLRRVPAAQVERGEHGTKPVADHETPLTQATAATQLEVVAFHT
jgi:hypothetical protein